MFHSVSVDLWSMNIEQLRRETTAMLIPNNRSQLGQYFTPQVVAELMVSFFNESEGVANLLEPSAGVGNLIDAFMSRFASITKSITAIELDPIPYQALDQYLKVFKENSSVQSINTDFVDWGLESYYQSKTKFTHIVLNPPYKKIGGDSKYRRALSQVTCDHVNIYTGFIALCILLLEQDGEVVAIVPRSFCNGLYFRDFRRFLLGRICLNRIHTFESRTSSFSDDGVLQENVILHLSKRPQTETIIVSQTTSSIAIVDNERIVPFSKIVDIKDKYLFIHIPTEDGGELAYSNSLNQLGLEVSTGPVVDYRVNAYLRDHASSHSYPLIYPIHFNGISIDFPKEKARANFLEVSNDTKASFWPTGFYTVVRRLSSKEERRRIVAKVVTPSSIEAEQLAFENHINVYHQNKRGIDKYLAFGLAAYLSTSKVDSYFRSFNGSTQVNATDLRKLKYPSLEVLRSIGLVVESQASLDVVFVDSLFKGYEG